MKPNRRQAGAAAATLWATTMCPAAAETAGLQVLLETLFPGIGDGRCRVVAAGTQVALRIGVKGASVRLAMLPLDSLKVQAVASFSDADVGPFQRVNEGRLRGLDGTGQGPGAVLVRGALGRRVRPEPAVQRHLGRHLALLGDREKDAALLKANSPLTHAARIKNPLLRAYGGADHRVPIEHGRRLYEAIKGHNKNLEWVLYDMKAMGGRCRKHGSTSGAASSVF
jgi:fermentation-respiration switch protein FrsA (DUF1100 family)